MSNAHSEILVNTSIMGAFGHGWKASVSHDCFKVRARCSKRHKIELLFAKRGAYNTRMCDAKPREFRPIQTGTNGFLNEKCVTALSHECK